MRIFLAAALTLTFFIADHDLWYSVHPFESKAPDVFADEMASGSLKRQVCFLFIGAVSAITWFRYRDRRRVKRSFLALMLSAFAVWAGLSVLWANAPGLALRRIIVFLIISLTSLAVALCCSPKHLVWFVAFSSAVYLAIGITAELELGTFHPLQTGYRFAGTLHPNDQGTNCALLFLSSLALLRNRDRRVLMPSFFATLGLGFLLLTGSRTAFGSSLAVVLLYLLIRVCRGRIAPAVLSGTVALVLLGAIVQPLASASWNALLLGRQEGTSTFAVRVELWRDLLDYLQQRPLAGYGYGGFWTPARISIISDDQHWSITSSHSEYLEIALDLGVIGLALYVVTFGAALRHAARFAVQECTRYSRYYLGLIIFYMLSSALEVHLFYPILLTLITIIALIHLGAGSHEMREYMPD
jgi:exopolysaccharide production protein ExoQ